MKPTEKITKIAKIAASTAVDTAIGCVEYTALAAPVAITITAVANKAANGTWNVKGAAIAVAKNAATAITAITAVNTAIAAATATTNAIKNTGIFANNEDEETTTSVDEFDDWDEEDEEA